MSIIAMGTEVVISGIDQLNSNPVDFAQQASGVVVGAAAVVAGVVKVIGGLFKAGRAKRRRRAAAAEKKRLRGELKSLEKSRQAVINPYENTKDISVLAKDLSGKLSNPFANLGVSTAAAEMEIEEADISLANTLDTLRATGASAGGATALAQAALQSKKGVAASIEKQEAANEKLRAGGEERLQEKQVKEQQRIQGVQIQEGRRIQDYEGRGNVFKFNAQEKRDQSKIAYKRREITGEKKREDSAYKAETAGYGDAIQGVGDVAQAYAGGGNMKWGGSDRRLKKNIKLIGKSFSGLKIYAFEYIDKIFGDGIWQGVMSDEIPQHAVSQDSNGYDRVDYSKLDVEFKQI